MQKSRQIKIHVSSTVIFIITLSIIVVLYNTISLMFCTYSSAYRTWRIGVWTTADDCWPIIDRWPQNEGQMSPCKNCTEESVRFRFFRTITVRKRDALHLIQFRIVPIGNPPWRMATQAFFYHTKGRIDHRIDNNKHTQFDKERSSSSVVILLHSSFVALNDVVSRRLISRGTRGSVDIQKTDHNLFISSRSSWDTRAWSIESISASCHRRRFYANAPHQRKW